MPRGGARPGAGRKSAKTEKYQAARRAQVEALVTPEEWAAVLRGQVKQAQKGNVKAFNALAPWVMGAVPQSVEVTGDGHIRVEVTYADAGPPGPAAAAPRSGSGQGAG